MHATFTTNGGSHYDPAEEKKKRRQQILDDKNLNIWQKKALLEQEEEGLRKPVIPVRLDSTKPQDKPKVEPVKNPFTYLNKANYGDNPPKPKQDVPPSPPPETDRKRWLMERGVPLQAAEAMLKPAQEPEDKPGSEEWLEKKGVPREAAEALVKPPIKQQQLIPKKNKGWVETADLESRPGYNLTFTVRDHGMLSPMYRGLVPTQNVNSPVLRASGTYDPIQKAAAEEAREFLDKEVSKYSYATLASAINSDLENKLDRDKFLNDGLSIADLGLSVYKGFSDASQETTPLTLPWVIDGGIRTFVNEFGDEPSLSDFKIDTMGNEMKKGDDKINFINNTDYKYLLNSVDDTLYGNGPKSHFLRTLKEQVDSLDTFTPDYGTKSENEQYKKAYLDYLKLMIDMNERSDHPQLDQEMKRIDDYYR